MALTTIVVGGVIVLLAWRRRCQPPTEPVRQTAVGRTAVVPTSVNYHFTRECNFACGFCFHTAKNSFVAKIEHAKQALTRLKEAGMRKINFAGGEPLLRKYREFLGELIRFAKEDLELESVSIVSNGSQLDKKIDEPWFAKYGPFIDVLAISCDSTDEKVNQTIGRAVGRAKQLDNLSRAKELCDEHGIKFKINSVCNKLTWFEDMNSLIDKLKPTRWKVFQVLVLQGENAGEDAKRNAETFAISDEQFDAFQQRHKHQACAVFESNDKMRNSYLILDEHLRFLDCSGGGKEPSGSILDVGVQAALSQAGFDQTMFVARGGVYDWSRKEPPPCNNGGGDIEDISISNY